MKKKLLPFSLMSLFLACVGLISCSSGDDGTQDDNTGDNSGATSGKVPDNTDSGVNNNQEPDNIIPSNPGNPGEDNPGSGDDNNNGGTGGDDNNSGGTGDDNNNGGTGGGDNNNGGTGGDNNNGGTGGDDNAQTWTLVFEDNFGDASDDEITYPSSEYWSLAQKGTDTWNRYMSESYDQAFQKGGYLYLYGERVDGEYKTGGIESRNKYDFTYGQVKCRARFLRQPHGNHTGIWMMPRTEQYGAWPRSGEIDIMEHLNDMSHVTGTVHFWDESLDKGDSKYGAPEVDNNEFNVYGVIWDKESVKFTLNGEVYFTYKNDDPNSDEFSYQYPFIAPFYLILSQSLGGPDTEEGDINNSELPSIFQIDWIKVWQKTDSAE